VIDSKIFRFLFTNILIASSPNFFLNSTNSLKIIFRFGVSPSTFSNREIPCRGRQRCSAHRAMCRIGGCRHKGRRRATAGCSAGSNDRRFLDFRQHRRPRFCWPSLHVLDSHALAPLGDSLGVDR